MLSSGTGPESYITECTLVCEDTLRMCRSQGLIPTRFRKEYGFSQVIGPCPSQIRLMALKPGEGIIPRNTRRGYIAEGQFQTGTPPIIPFAHFLTGPRQLLNLPGLPVDFALRTFETLVVNRKKVKSPQARCPSCRTFK